MWIDWLLTTTFYVDVHIQEAFIVLIIIETWISILSMTNEDESLQVYI